MPARQMQPTREIHSARSIKIAFALALASLSACSDRGAATVDVFAGSSLTSVLMEAEVAFETLNPDIDVRLNLAGSNTLARQIQDGNGAEVFIPADVAAASEITDRLGDGTALARNRLVMIISEDLATLLKSPASPAEALANAGSLARCASGVPCGDAAEQWMSSEPFLPEVARISQEANVRAVLAKVRSGEVDVGLVYATDARFDDGGASSNQQAGRGVSTIDLGVNAPITRIVGFPVLSGDGETHESAPMFLQYLASPAGQELFAGAGFMTP